MDHIVPVRALISVSDKTGVVDLAKLLHEQEVELLSTGGTARSLREVGLPIKEVGDYTGQPEIMDGRVKTLHPIIHGGILARRDVPDHTTALFNLGAGLIDLVIVNLYPFETTVQSGAPPAECVEHIDIGGPAMVRSAAKNHQFVTVVTNPSDYEELSTTIRETGGTQLALRRALASRAFAHTAAYDAQIARWFGEQIGDEFPREIVIPARLREHLRYGENPQQKAAFYVTSDRKSGVAGARQLQGKPLSYNNINDTDAAFELVCEFDEPAVAIIKHANPCGVAIGSGVVSAFERALACDPLSAFGGIVACNQSITSDLAEKMLETFFEVIIGPSIHDEASAVFKRKANLRVLAAAEPDEVRDAAIVIRSVTGGLLLQSKDDVAIGISVDQIVTDKSPSAEQLADLAFAMKVCRHVKSNAIVLARDGAAIGIGAGQMSRVDAVEAAVKKAEAIGGAKNSVLASDAFFPFSDGLVRAIGAGVKAVAQPGGSVRDEEVIAAANAADIAMVFTGTRHFRH